MDGGAWWAAIYGVAQSQTRLKRLSSSSNSMGWFQKEGLLFLPENLQWNFINSIHSTTHLGENALQRLLERCFRGTGLQKTIRQVVSSCPTCQLNNPQGVQRLQLAQPIQLHGIYPGEEWKLVNSLHATTQLEEKTLQRLLERSFRGTGLQGL